MAKKKFVEHDMYESAHKALRSRYKKEDGWEIIAQDQSKTGYRPDFLVKKEAETGFFSNTPQKKVLVEVKAEKIITHDHIKQLDGYSKKHAGGNSTIECKHLIVPAGADLSKVQNTIEKNCINVIRLKGFKR